MQREAGTSRLGDAGSQDNRPAAATESSPGKDAPPLDKFHRQLPARPKAVRAALNRVVAQFAPQIPEETVGALELALAEALNNIVEHAYAESSGGRILLRLWRDGDLIRCSIEDGGLPMPDGTPPAGVMPQPTESLDDMIEGGWGWALIRAVASEVIYERAEGCNRLTFTIPIHIG